MEVDLSGLFGGLPDAERSRLSEPFELRWDAATLYGEANGRVQTLPRARARETGGLVGRLPDEPEGLVRWLRSGRAARSAERDDTVRFRVPADALGAGTTAVAGDARPSRLRFAVTVDGDGRPAVVTYSFTRPRVERGGATVLPARSITVTYRLDDFGDEADVGAPER